MKAKGIIIKYFFIGNTMIDSLISFKQFFNCDDILSKQKINKNEYAWLNS